MEKGHLLRFDPLGRAIHKHLVSTDWLGASTLVRGNTSENIAVIRAPPAADFHDGIRREHPVWLGTRKLDWAVGSTDPTRPKRVHPIRHATEVLVANNPLIIGNFEDRILGRTIRAIPNGGSPIGGNDESHCCRRARLRRIDRNLHLVVARFHHSFVVVDRVNIHANPDLPEVIHARDSFTLGLCLGQRGEKHSRQDRDYCDDDQEFYQGEGPNGIDPPRVIVSSFHGLIKRMAERNAPEQALFER